MSISRAEHTYVLKLAYQVLTLKPDIRTAELARQLGVSIRTAYNYRNLVQAGVPVPEDPMQAVRRYLEKNPRAGVKEVRRDLGLKKDTARRRYETALADMEKNPTPLPPPVRPAPTYKIPKFRALRVKEK